MLGHYLSGFFSEHGYAVTALRKTHSVNISGVREIEIDLLDFAALNSVISQTKPGCIIHCAGLTNVDACEKNPTLAKSLHVDLSAEIARLASHVGSKLVHISTDHLWDGRKPMVSEEEPVCPVNVYGETKAKGESVVLTENSDALVLRTNFFGQGLPWRSSLSDWIINTLKSGQIVKAFNDAYFTPISLHYLSGMIMKLLDKNATGIYHTIGAERISKYDFALALARSIHVATDRIVPVSIADAELFAARPLDMSLASKKITAFLGEPAPRLQESIDSLRGQKL